MINADFPLLPAEPVPQTTSTLQHFNPADNEFNGMTSLPPLETLGMDAGVDEGDDDLMDEQEVQALARKQAKEKER